MSSWLKYYVATLEIHTNNSTLIRCATYCTWIEFEFFFAHGLNRLRCFVIRGPGMQIKRMLTQKVSQGRSLLAEAAFGGNRATFETVLKIIRTRLSSEEV